MQKVFQLFIYLSISFTCYPQVGIHTTTPAGMLEVTSGDKVELGLVLPIVAKFENVENAIAGERVKRGTFVFDEQRNTLCYKTISGWSCMNGDTIPDPIDPTAIPIYIKASNTRERAYFGYAISISSDGNTLAVGSYGESSGSSTNQASTTAANSGAVYVYARSGNTWVQKAYLKALYIKVGGFFGYSVSLSSDGNTLAVGASRELLSGVTSVNNPNGDSKSGAGRVYIYTQTNGTWSLLTSVVAFNFHSGSLFHFGTSVALSSDGSTLAVGAEGDSSPSTGIGGNGIAPSELEMIGSAYVYTRTSTNTYIMEAYIKPPIAKISTIFGRSVSLSSDGNTLVVGATGESSSARGINANLNINTLNGAGAVYVYTRTGTTWVKEVHIKSSNTREYAYFGGSVSLSSDGNTLAVGSHGESSNSTGINGIESDASASYAGAVYVYTRTGTTWVKEAYIKATNTRANANFGRSVSLSSDGNTLAVGSDGESSNSIGINGVEGNTSASSAGAVYYFTRSGTTWGQEAYIKATNTRAGNKFGRSVALSSDGNTLAVGSDGESSSATGVGPVSFNTTAPESGAVYVYEIR